MSSKKKSRKRTSVRSERPLQFKRLEMQARLLVIAVIALAILILFFLGLAGDQRIQSDSRPNANSFPARKADRPIHRDELIAKAVTEPIRQQFTPVALLAQGEFKGSGTLFESPGGLELIFSSVHVFSDRGRPLPWTYQKISPFNPVQYPISEIKRFAGWQSQFAFEPDVIAVIPGQSQLINGYANWHEVLPLAEVFPYEVGKMEKDIWLTSLVTGKSYKVLLVAYDKKTDAIPYFFFNCPLRPGESGTGFVDKDRNDLLVVAGGIFGPPPEIKAQFAHLLGDTYELTYGCPIQFIYDQDKRQLTFSHVSVIRPATK